MQELASTPVTITRWIFWRASDRTKRGKAVKDDVKDEAKDPTETLIPAMYKPAVLPQHAGNPLIEALPRFSTAEEFLPYIGVTPPFSEDDRRQSANVRMLSVLSLRDFFTPQKMHLRVIEQMGLVILGGYAYRNPAKPDYKKAQIEFYRQRMEGAIIPITLPRPATAPSFSVFGVSGMGKSSIVERILSFYPQALAHPQHHILQLVWLKADCPMDGSLKQLLLGLVLQIDAILGTQHYKTVKFRNEIDKLILDVAKIAAQVNLGVLIIDEVQHLLEARGVGPATMLNFFVTFTNTVKVPLVLVGTPKADKMFSTLFREARRASEDGNVRWDRMAPDGGWKFFIEDLWPFQWTTHPTPLTDELSQAMYFETQGITALAVRLYQLVQLEAIRSRKELITKKLISDVAAENFILLKPALTALREGKVKLIAKFDDFFSQWSEEIDAKLQSVSQQSPVISSATRSNRSLSMRLKKNLMELGVPPNEIEALVRKLKASRAADDGGDDAWSRKYLLPSAPKLTAQA
jgi:hypothetical protein